MYNHVMIKLIKKLFIGICIGSANVIPGVSGGTIAVILDVYDDLIALASFNFSRIKKFYREYIFLCTGVGIGIIVFAKLIKMLYDISPDFTNFFFSGIILGSLPVLYSNVSINREKLSKTAIKILSAAAGLALMTSLPLIQNRYGISQNGAIDHLSVKIFIQLFLIGFAASTAMIIPGISGSFILLVLGAYTTITTAVANLDVLILLPAALGGLAGFFLTAKLISFLLEKASEITYAFILGLVAGSVFHIMPCICAPVGQKVIAILCLTLGYILISIFSESRPIR